VVLSDKGPLVASPSIQGIVLMLSAQATTRLRLRVERFKKQPCVVWGVVIFLTRRTNSPCPTLKNCELLDLCFAYDLRLWLYRSSPLSPRMDPATNAVDNHWQGQALAALFGVIGEGPGRW